MSLRSALAGGGAVLAVVAAVAGFSGGAVVEDRADVVDQLPALSVDDRCPDGWEYIEVNEHAVRRVCWRAPWSVTLYPAGREANYGLNTTAGENAPTTPCLEIPNWPADRCLP